MSNTPLKQQLSIKLDQSIYSHVRTKPNMSRYIESLIKQDLQMEKKQFIYEAIMDELFKDKIRLPQLARLLNGAANKPAVQKNEDYEIIQETWA